MKIETGAEQLLFSTLRIETPSSVGTGFIVQHPLKDGQGLCLVTNKHVIESTKEGRLTFTRLRLESGVAVPDLGQSEKVQLTGDEWKWTGHPSGDVDITAMPLVPLLDALGKAGKQVFFKSVPTNIIPDQKALEELDAVEEVLFIGYPNNVFDRVNNLPIYRKGITATHSCIDYENKPTFLVDASVFPGSSGSPVFIYNVGGWTGRHGMTVGNRIMLLGVLSAVLYRQADGSLEFRDIPTAIKPVIHTQEMIDLGIVFKARTVVETIEHLIRQYGVSPAS